MKIVTLWVVLTVLAFAWVDHVLNGVGTHGFVAGFVQSLIK